MEAQAEAEALGGQIGPAIAANVAAMQAAAEMGLAPQGLTGPTGFGVLGGNLGVAAPNAPETVADVGTMHGLTPETMADLGSQPATPMSLSGFATGMQAQRGDPDAISLSESLGVPNLGMQGPFSVEALGPLESGSRWARPRCPESRAWGRRSRRSRGTSLTCRLG